MGQGTHRIRVRRTHLALLVVGAIALAACTSSSGSDTPGSFEDSIGSSTTRAARSSTTTTTAAPTTTTVAPTTTTAAPTTTTAAPTPPPGPAIPAGDDAVVTRVTDGDTIVVNGSTKVRLIGVDTPEVYFGAQFYGPEASGFTKSVLLPGMRVRLEYDNNRTDRYGRTLAYVYRLSDGLNVQVALLQQGFAAAYPFDDTPRYHAWFAAEATRAKAAGVGGWSSCAGRDGPLAGPAVK
jgi:micrococcal nuclease